jgi:hypothetical protein
VLQPRLTASTAQGYSGLVTMKVACAERESAQRSGHVTMVADLKDWDRERGKVVASVAAQETPDPVTAESLEALRLAVSGQRPCPRNFWEGGLRGCVSWVPRLMPGFAGSKTGLEHHTDQSLARCDTCLAPAPTTGMILGTCAQKALCKQNASSCKRLCATVGFFA